MSQNAAKFRGHVAENRKDHCRTKNPWCSLVFRGFQWSSLMFKRKCVGKTSSVTKESVQEFFRLQDVINAYRGTSTEIVILDDEYPMFTES